MAIKGAVEAHCPKGCEAVQVEVWSYFRADADEDLRERLLAGDLNLIACESCGELFVPEASVVYADPSAELLAFIFPESYRAEEAKWRAKMREDYARMKDVLGSTGEVETEPVVYFGMQEAVAKINEEADLEDEVQVAGYLAKDLGLGLYPVDRAWARERGLPRVVAHVKPGKKGAAVRREDMLAGTLKLLEANDRLRGFRRWVTELGASDAVPPKGRTR